MSATTKLVLVLVLLVIVLTGGTIGLGVMLLNAQERAKLAELNTEAALDSSRILTDSLEALEGRHAAERLALQMEVGEKDAAIAERERQLGARAVAYSRLRVQRDSLQRILMVQEDPELHGDTSVYVADTAGIQAKVEVTPALDTVTTVRLSLSFEPTEVLQAFLRDEDGRVSLLAITDSLHSVSVTDPPVFEPPAPRGWFSWDLNVGPVAVMGVGCAAAGLTSKAFGASWGEAGAITGICAGSVLGLAIAF
jgi:hypothetical protein